ncbi:MAG: 50S ribosomal protein L17 [Myxococcota bacterium]|nr:50S ribosomal protein L17 [Myxococcota bacterium]
MRHQNGIKKIGRNRSHRIATLRNMATALFQHERIETTEAKAKALRPFAEKLITLAKRGDVHARRMAGRDIQDSDVLKKLFSEIGPRFTERPGGYTRVLRKGFRSGDHSPLSMIMLVESAAVTRVLTEGDA